MHDTQHMATRSGAKLALLSGQHDTCVPCVCWLRAPPLVHTAVPGLLLLQTPPPTSPALRARMPNSPRAASLSFTHTCAPRFSIYPLRPHSGHSLLHLGDYLKHVLRWGPHAPRSSSTCPCMAKPRPHRHLERGLWCLVRGVQNCYMACALLIEGG